MHRFTPEDFSLACIDAENPGQNERCAASAVPMRLFNALRVGRPIRRWSPWRSTRQIAKTHGAWHIWRGPSSIIRHMSNRRSQPYAGDHPGGLNLGTGSNNSKMPPDQAVTIFWTQFVPQPPRLLNPIPRTIKAKPADFRYEW